MASEFTPSLGEVSAGPGAATGAGAASEQATVSTASKTIAAVAIKDIDLQFLRLYVFIPKYYSSRDTNSNYPANSCCCVIHVFDIL
jgi:hypothetical protein